MKLFAPSEEGRAALIKKLKSIDIKYKEKERFDPPVGPETTSLKVSISGTVDHQIKRAIAKTLFNFAAFYICKEEVCRKV